MFVLEGFEEARLDSMFIMHNWPPGSTEGRVLIGSDFVKFNIRNIGLITFMHESRGKHKKGIGAIKGSLNGPIDVRDYFALSVVESRL